MFKKLLFSLDYYLIVPTLILVFLSFFVLSSFQIELARSQALFAIAGTLIFISFLFVHPDWFKGYAYYLYAVVFALLVAVDLIGVVTKGANRWLTIGDTISMQPSEFAKPVIIILLAKLFSEREHTIFTYVLTFLYTGFYFYLIFKQPDLATALTFIVIWVVFVFFSDISLKKLLVWILSLLILGAAVSPIAWNFLHDYQRNRILTFMDPGRDPLGTGYNVLQSIITVGSGGFLGKGYGQGTQARNNFLPEHYTDFAFATFSEEFGFIGVVVLLILYSIILLRIFIISERVKYRFGFLMVVVVAALLLLQVFVNVGMNTGIVPVAGITLPFFSYGGSSLISFFTCIGIVQAVERSYTVQKYELSVDS